MVATHRTRYTRAEYIAFERSSNAKHEYLGGAIYAMAGGSREHAAFPVNVSTLLSVALRGRPCAVHSSDLRIRIVDTGLETYPDVTVVRGRVEIAPEDGHVVLNPIVLVEVEQLVEVIRREDDGTWSRHEARRGGAAKLVSLGCELPVDEVYRDPLGAA